MVENEDTRDDASEWCVSANVEKAQKAGTVAWLEGALGRRRCPWRHPLEVQRHLRDDAGMEQSITVEIAAPAERVWEVLVDVERWSEWTETVTRVRRLDEGPLRSGSRARINQPKIPENEYVVTDLDPGRSFTWVATGPGVTTTARHEVEALPGGGTQVRLAVEQGGWLGSVMGRFYRGLTDRYLANEAAGLKSRCEGER